MTDRSQALVRKSRLQKAISRFAEALEPRQYLTGLVYGSPVNTTTASLGLSPVFANLFPFVNGTTKADLFVANSTGSVSVLVSNGDGSFSSNVDTVPVAGTPLPLAVGQFTSSGNWDIAAGTSGNPTGDVSILLGNGDGTFKSAINIPALGNNQAIAVAQFGGHEDIISVSNSPSNVNDVAVILGNGDGTFKAPYFLSLPFGSASSIAAGDFNGDGKQDFVVVGQNSDEVAVYMGNGNGTFQAPATYATGPSPTSIAVGNFRNKTINGLPELDIVTADSTGGEVSFLANNGNGTFAAPVNSPVAGTSMGAGPLKVRISDLNSDGIPDLICLDDPNSTDQATCLLGNGDGTFHTGALISIPGGTRNAIAAGDLVGAMTPLTDLVLTNSTQITALLNITAGDRTTPTATVTPTATGSTSSTSFQFTVTYTDSEQIDASTLSSSNLTVTLPDGSTSVSATLVPMNYGNDASLAATYSVSLPGNTNLTSGDNGTYTVLMNPSNEVTNAGGVPVTSGTIGTFALTVQNSNVDNTPPTASVDATQATGSSSSNLYQFTVTYTDNVAVDASTLGNGNLVVTFPASLNSSTQAATLVSTGLANGASVQATYQITFPANLSTNDNGTYNVSINADSVTDTSGNPVAAGSIGSFMLSVSSSAPPPGPTGIFTVTAPTGKIIASPVVEFTRQGSLAVHVTNNGTTNGNAPVTGLVTVTLYASDSAIHDSGSVAITSVNHRVVKLKVGKNFIVHFKPFKYPDSGTVYLVADAALTGALNSTDGATTAITVAPQITHGVAETVGTTKPLLVAGTRYTAFLTVENGGNIPYNGSATVDVAVEPTGGSATTISAPVAVKLHIPVGQKRRIAVNFTPGSLPPSGSDYGLILTIVIPGDALNTSATSTTLLSI